LISKVIVIRLDLWTLIVVGQINHSLDHVGVVNTKFLHCCRLAFQLRKSRGSQKSLKLLLLVSMSMLFHNNFYGKLLQELVFEGISGVLLDTREIRENFFSFSSHSSKVLECLSGGRKSASDLRELSDEDLRNIIFCLTVRCPCGASLSLFGSEFSEIA